MLCIWWYQKSFVYYKLLKPGDFITSNRYRLQLIRLSRALREKRSEYEQRHDKVIILLHDNARPHVAKKIFRNAQMGCFTRTRRILRTLLLLIIGCSEGCRTIWQVTGSFLSQKLKIGSKIGSPPKTSHFFKMKFENCLRDGKK